MATTTYQIGQTVYIPYTDTGQILTDAVIATTESIYGQSQTNYYTFEGMQANFRLPESLVFETKEALETYSDNLIDTA